MDHQRFRQRASDLRAYAQLLNGLSRMPTEESFDLLVAGFDLIVGAANDLDDLRTYAKITQALKNETRMKLVAAALSGTSGGQPIAQVGTVVERAIAIADEALRRITEAP